MVTAVNWSHLALAVDYYKLLGYEYKEVDWIEDREIINITAPHKDNVFDIKSKKLDNKYSLIGSGEQSFMALNILDDQLYGSYVTCTPCFRNEGVNDELHQIQFMKVELFKNDSVSDHALDKLIFDAQECFNTLAFMRVLKHKLQVVKTEDGYDIIINGIEVGSYGRRTYKNKTWLYATGLAEPRFSQALRNI